MYKKISKADQKNIQGGYKNVVLFAPASDFATVARPVIGATPAAGDSVRVTGNHTFSTGAGFYNWACTKHSVTTTAETTGDNVKSLVHKAKFSLLGDSASTLEQVQALLNDEVIFLVKDQDCLTATDYIQLGDDCVTPDITVSFDGQTSKEGEKQYTIELSVKSKKFFYSGTVTEKP